MKRILTAFLGFVVISTAFPQAPNWQWAQSATMSSSSSNGAALGVGLATDAADNVFVTGNFRQTSMTFGTTTLMNTAVGSSDMFIAAYSSTGTPQWAHSNGGTSFDNGMSLVTDNAGNVYLYGDFQYDDISFGGTTLVNQGVSDLFLVKYSQAGNVLWAKSMGGTDSDNSTDIAIDANGNIYITGYSESPSITFGNQTFSGPGAIFVVKYDPAGNVIWAVHPAGSGIGQSIDIDDAGNVLLTGRYLNGTITFGSTTLTYSGNSDIYIAKFDAAGNVIWARGVGGANFDWGNSVASDDQGNVYVSGQVQSSVTFDPGVAITATSTTNFLVKYDPNGTAKWVVVKPKYVAVGPDNVIYATGMFNNTYSFGSTSLTSAGANDVFVAAYDSLGNVLWATKAGGTAGDEVYAIAVDGSGSCIITGDYPSQGITFGSIALPFTGSTGMDYYLAKLAPAAVGLNTVNDVEKLVLYPNPASDHLQLKGIKGPFDYCVYNTIGEKVKEGNVNGNADENYRVQLNDLPDGLYFLELKNQGARILRKFIK